MPMEKKIFKNKNLTIQIKLMGIFLLTTVILFSINLYMYSNINNIILKIESIYASNTDLSQLKTALDQVQSSMSEYLSTKSSDSMEEYFRSEQSYQNLIRTLNNEVVSDEGLLMEKNIRNMSEDYLKLTNTAIETKRSRNISKYILSYEEASAIYSCIDDFIYSLNNQQFQNNSQNYQLLTSSLKYSEAINMTILCTTGFLDIFLIIILLRGITRPLKELAHAAGQVAEGNLEIYSLKVYSHDEIGIVTDAFNQMVSRLKDHIARLKTSMEMESALKEKELKMEAHLKEAQLKYLQAQINPHFLFNTLNAGAQLAMMEGADKTYRYTQNVANFFRYNLKNSQRIVTLKEEIQMVDYYIYILNVRYSNEIQYEKNLDGRFLNVQIPSMTLQPIVENSIKYGISDINWQGIINLSVEDGGQHVDITIRDNGIGMTEEKIHNIMNGEPEKTQAKDSSGGIGLNNLISRLKLYLGEESEFQINSPGKDKGTEVVIRVPKMKEESYVQDYAGR